MCNVKILLICADAYQRSRFVWLVLRSLDVASMNVCQGNSTVTNYEILFVTQTMWNIIICVHCTKKERIYHTRVHARYEIITTLFIKCAPFSNVLFSAVFDRNFFPSLPRCHLKIEVFWDLGLNLILLLCTKWYLHCCIPSGFSIYRLGDLSSKPS